MGLRREARAALAAAGRRPRKRWGQNFLCDAAAVQRIVTLAALEPDGHVVEIGAGLGALSDALVERAATLYLVEIDPVLADHLRERYRSMAHVHVVEGDVLTAALSDLLPPAARGVVVANLPYSVSTPVLFRLLEWRARLPRAVVMLQREVAQRITARPGTRTRGALGVMIETYADVRAAFSVSPASFHPQPRVHSVVLDVRWHASPQAEIGDEAFYAAVVHAAFGQRRKMLRNALAGLAGARGLDGAGLDAVFRAAGVDGRVRAETLSVDDFARLARGFDEA